MGRLGRIKALIIKEFQNIWNDPRNRRMILWSPVIQLVIFAYAVSLEVKNVNIAIYDKDNSTYSREFVQKINQTEMVKDIIYVDNRTDLKSKIDKQDALLGVIIPENFSRNIMSKEGTTVQMILDGRQTNSAQIASGYISFIVQQYQQDVLGQKSTADVRYRYWFNPTLDFQWTMVIMMTGILSLSMALSMTAISIAQEKELGTFDQILVSPLKSSEILFAKTFVAIVLSLFDMSTMLLMAIFHFKIPLTTNIFVLYAVVALFLLSISGVGLFISSLCNTQQQSILGVFVFMVPAMLLSGFVTSIDNLPLFFQGITIINPLTYFMILIKGMFLKSMPMHLIVKNCIPLAIISVVTMSFSSWYFSKKRE